MSQTNRMKMKLFVYLIYAILGGALILCASLGYIEDFWSGFGCGLIAIAVFRLIQFARYSKDEAYAQKLTVEQHDERNKALAEKSRSRGYYYSVLLEGLAVIFLRIFGLPEYSVLMAYVVCGQLIIYWVSYLFLRKKY